MNKLNATEDGQSLDLRRDNLDRLKALFPDLVCDGKVDFEALKDTFSEDLHPPERYSFTWHGKSQARRITQTPTTGTLRPCPEESVNWDTTQNLFIEGDNLEVLKLLQKSYHKKIKMVYIDPPYNTGNDFVYPDNFNDNVANYLDITGQVGDDGRRFSANSETLGRYHTNWLNMMYPRLKLARNLMRDDGVIFISIDDNECPRLRQLCDEIFGEDNFVAQISVINNPAGRLLDKYIGTCHEYLVVYAKNELPDGALAVSKSPEEMAKSFPKQDEHGAYRDEELRNGHREFGRHNRPKLYYPIYVAEDGSVSLDPAPDHEEILPIWDDGFEGCWTWGNPKARDEVHLLRGKRVKGAWKIYRRSYASAQGDAPTKKVKTVWSENGYFTKNGQSAFNALFDTREKVFQSPKPVDLLKTAMEMAQVGDGYILDFFSGSCTTAHATLASNGDDQGSRKFIMIQLPELCDKDSEAFKAGFETIAEIGKERIRKVGQQLAAAHEASPSKKLDLGFRVYKLDSSNIKSWDGQREATEQSLLDIVDPIKEDRSESDVLYEILLKYGLNLNLPVETRVFDGRTVYAVGFGALMVCLSEAIALDVVNALGAWKVKLGSAVTRVVFRDGGFADDLVKANAIEDLKRYDIHDVKSI